ncbi:V-type ATP synthase subunit B, partial [bacterium]|nr:V-type ATP synthase subunit B [bacterium]
MVKEYLTVSHIAGPLILVEETSGIKYGEIAEIELATKEVRRGKVLEVTGDKALV